MSRLDWLKVLELSWLDVVKALVSAVVILLATRIQQVNDRISALVIALPLVSVLAMIWMYAGGQSSQRLANHAESTFWFVLATLPMFLLMPWMLRSGWGFWVSLGLGCLLTLICLRLTVAGLRNIGIELLP
jgi:hypothetical protein